MGTTNGDGAPKNARDYGARSRMIGGPDEDGPEVTSCNLNRYRSHADLFSTFLYNYLFLENSEGYQLIPGWFLLCPIDWVTLMTLNTIGRFNGAIPKMAAQI